MGNSGWQKVVAPNAAFSFLPFNIQRLNDTFRVDPIFDLQTYSGVVVNKTYYVKMASEGGNDAASGADEANALATISAAILKADVDRVMVKAGIYNGAAGMNAYVPNHDLEVIGYGGDVICPTDIIGLAFSAVDNHYEAARPTGIHVVYDSSVLDDFGDYVPLTYVVSAAEVEATAGTWFWGTDVLYVHTVDSRAPDADIHCSYGTRTYNAVHNTANTYYIEGLHFYGSLIPFILDSTSPDCKLYLKNCSFKYGSNNTFTWSGLRIGGGGEIIAENCVFARCAQDGVQINVKTAQSPNVALINCDSRSHGLTVNTNNNSNGVSRHGPGNSVIINSRLYNTYGPNILDVNDGTYTWMLGCTCTDSVGTAFRHNYGISNASFMWLDRCTATGVAADNQLYASVGANLYYRKMNPSTPTKKEITGGVVNVY